MRKQTKIAAIVSAAALLALGASMTSFAATGWQEENGVWVYYNKQGEQVTDTWAKSGDSMFYLNDQGEMSTDARIEDNDHLYYVDSNGAMVTNRWVAFDNENAGEDGNQPNTLWYYFGNNGRAYKGVSGRLSLKTINGKKYAFDEEGKMLYGWVHNDGYMVNEEETTSWMNGDYYFGDENDGAMTTGWKLITVEDADPQEDQPSRDFWDTTQERWFNFKNSGKKNKDKRDVSIGGAKYGFDEWGRMVADWYTETTKSDTAYSTTTPDGSQGVASYSNSFMYFSTPEDGARKTKGWFKVVAGYYLNKGDYEDGADAWYYAESNGKIAANKIMTINGKRYLFDSNGKMQSGLVFLDRRGADLVILNDKTNPKKPDSREKLIQEFLTADIDSVKNGKLGAYYFGDGNDGALKTGNQTLSFNDETTRWNFKTASATMGAGVHGKKDNRLYVGGLLYTANSDDKFVAVVVRADGLVEEKTVEQLTGLANPTTGTLNPAGTIRTYNFAPWHQANPNDAIYLVNTSGNIVKSGSKKDGSGNVFKIQGSKVQTLEITQ